MTWTLAQAKTQLSEVVRRARTVGPQTISVQGREEVVVISREALEALAPRPGSIKDWLMSLDLEGVDLERDQTPARDIEL